MKHQVQETQVKLKEGEFFTVIYDQIYNNEQHPVRLCCINKKTEEGYIVVDSCRGQSGPAGQTNAHLSAPSYRRTIDAFIQDQIKNNKIQIGW